MRFLSNKVPMVAAGFWLIKILSTTVGETVADFLAVDAGLGLLLTVGVMVSLLVVALASQLRSHRYRPWLYWTTVVLVSVVGTQITDVLTDKLGISLWWSSLAFGVLLASCFGAWYRSEGTLSIRSIDTTARELFYWTAILCTFALGTAVGDLATEALGLGFQLGSVGFGLLLVAVLLLFTLGANAALAFWAAYVLTRPLGASLGDWLSQSPEYGGLGLGAMSTSAIFLLLIVFLVSAEQLRTGPRSPA